MRRFPFVHAAYQPDPDAARLLLRQVVHLPAGGRAVRVAVRHQRLSRPARAAARWPCVFAATCSCRAQRCADGSALLACAGSSSPRSRPVYFVWMTPELFNFVAGALGVLLLALQGSGARRPCLAACDGFAGDWSDVAAVVLLGIATFSKPSNVMLIAPILLLLVARRRWMRGDHDWRAVRPRARRALPGNLPSLATGTFKGGERNTFYGAFPFHDRVDGLRRRPRARDQ